MEIEAKPGKGGQGSWLMPECVCVGGVRCAAVHIFICGHACVCMTVPSHFYHSTWESKGPSGFPFCFILEEGAALLFGGELFLSLGFPMEATSQKLFSLYLEMTLSGFLSQGWVSSGGSIHPDSLVYFRGSLH